MHEILFRGKSLGTKDWLEGSLFIDDKGEKHEILVGYVNYRISWEVDPETVGQYTGLKDKNGRRIFEGDIVFLANRFGKGLHWIVEWHNGTLSLKQGLCDYWACFEDMKGYAFEVVGNIHDNHELLGGA